MLLYLFFCIESNKTDHTPHHRGRAASIKQKKVEKEKEPFLAIDKLPRITLLLTS